MLAVGRTGGGVTLSSLVDGRPLRTLTGHSGAIDALEFSPDGHLVASVGEDDVAIVTEVATGRMVARLTEHTEPATAAAFTRNGRALYFASEDGTIIGWDLVNLNSLGEQLSPPSTDPNRIESMAAGFAGDVAIGHLDGTVQLWGPAARNPSGRRSRPTPSSASRSRQTVASSPPRIRPA